MRLLSDHSAAFIEAFFLWLVIAIASFYCWSRPVFVNAGPRSWAITSVVALIAGGFVFCIDMVVGSMFHPELALWAAALRGGIFGGMMTAICTAGFLLVSVGGIARGFITCSEN